MSSEDKIIYETANFYVTTGKLTFVSREDGGHLRIKMKQTVPDRTHLTPKLAIDYIRLTVVTQP